MIKTNDTLTKTHPETITTRSAAIQELRRLSKSHVYFLRMFGNQGLRIQAEWKSATSIDLSSEVVTMTKKRKKNVVTFLEMQKKLVSFQADIDFLCDITTVLATKDKQKKKLKGKLTNYEDYAFFQNMVRDVDQK